MGGVPKVTVLRVVDVDDSGRAWAVPERWEADGPPPRLRVMERKGRGTALGVGDRILAPHRGGQGRLDRPSDEEAAQGQRAGARRGPPGRRPTIGCDRSSARKGASCRSPSSARPRPGDLVLAEKVGRPPRLAARVDTVLGDPFAPRSFSLIAIHKYGIPHDFPDGVTRKRSGWRGCPGRARGPHPHPDRRDRPGRRARP